MEYIQFGWMIEFEADEIIGIDLDLELKGRTNVIN